jgi:hypothetical protein
VNCRQVEEFIFPDPAVAGILEKHYVEARLHTDDQANPERSARLEQLQQEMVQSLAQPYYIVIDPDTGKQLGKLAGSGQVSKFVEFFEKFLDRN